MNPLFYTEWSISDSLKSVRKSVLIYETIIFSLWKRANAVSNCEACVHTGATQAEWTRLLCRSAIRCSGASLLGQCWENYEILRFDILSQDKKLARIATKTKPARTIMRGNRFESSPNSIWQLLRQTNFYLSITIYLEPDVAANHIPFQLVPKLQ